MYLQIHLPEHNFYSPQNRLEKFLQGVPQAPRRGVPRMIACFLPKELSMRAANGFCAGAGKRWGIVAKYPGLGQNERNHQTVPLTFLLG